VIGIALDLSVVRMRHEDSLLKASRWASVGPDIP
jgi:hypothetical protein